MTGQETDNLVGSPPISIVKAESKPFLTPVTVETQPNNKKERGKAFRQVVAAFIANIGTINVGFAFGFSAVAVPQLQAPDSFIKVDESQASWVASLSSLGTPIGCVLGGYLMDTFGRKKTLIYTEVLCIIGWLIIAFATNVEMIYAGRVLVGIGSGMLGAPARVYTSEVTQPHLRGMLTALASFGISLGILLQYTFGSFLAWPVLAGLSTIVPVMAFVLMIFMPESPNYLVSKSNPEGAAKSLAKLRGSSYNVQKEISQLEEFAKRSNAKRLTSPKEIFAALIAPETLKPFGILVTYFMIYQFSGVNTITFYAVEIFRDSGTTMNKYTCTILLGVVRLVATAAAVIALRRCGRRPLTFVSGLGCGASMIGLGVYLYYKHTWETAIPKVEPVITWFPVACIFVFTIVMTLGFLVVPWVMIGELYPQKIRGVVGGLTTCMAHTFVFIVVKTYPFLSHAIYRHGAFIMYGCISTVGSIFFYLCLPETKGKTLQEIEDYFSGRTKTLNTKKIKLQNGFDNSNNNTKPPLIIVEKDKLLA